MVRGSRSPLTFCVHADSPCATQPNPKLSLRAGLVLIAAVCSLLGGAATGPPVAMGQTRVISTGRQAVTLEGLHLTGGVSGSGAAVYAEKKVVFRDCTFSDNGEITGSRGQRAATRWLMHAVCAVCLAEGSTDGAVMVTRDGEFYNCVFDGNRAKYAAGETRGPGGDVAHREG